MTTIVNTEVKQIVKESTSSKSNAGAMKYYYTRPFYTHHNGYKMQLRVYPYKDNKAISVYCHLMKGERDNHLRWPYKGNITITLLNQLEDSQHYTKTVHLGVSAEQAVSIKSDKIRNETGYGYPEFISLSKVESSIAHKQYLMNDTLYFKISATVTS